MEYSTTKFLVAFELGRTLRFTVLSLLTSMYGKHLFRLAEISGRWALMILLGPLIAVGLFLVARGMEKFLSNDGPSKQGARSVRLLLHDAAPLPGERGYKSSRLTVTSAANKARFDGVFPLNGSLGAATKSPGSNRDEIQDGGDVL
jgi:hypothetical protein